MRSLSGEHRGTRKVEAAGTHRNPSGVSLLISPSGEAIVNQLPNQSGKVRGTVPARTGYYSEDIGDGCINDSGVDF